jgi:hypothetical protein
MMVGDNARPERRCYGCGQQGHMRGAPECKAGKDAVWGGAPKAYLEKVQKKFGDFPMSSKRPVQEGQRQLCKFHQEGFCKYAERCHVEHEGQGGSKRPRDFNGKGKGLGKGKGKSKGKGKGCGKGKGKGGRAQRNSSMIVKKKGRHQEDGERSSSIMVGRSSGQDKDEEDQAENELYRLMRGGGYASEEEEDEDLKSRNSPPNPQNDLYRRMRESGYETEEEEDEVDDDQGEEDVSSEQEIEHLCCWLTG